jgi:hypothetical protein
MTNTRRIIAYSVTGIVMLATLPLLFLTRHYAWEAGYGMNQDKLLLAYRLYLAVIAIAAVLAIIYVVAIIHRPQAHLACRASIVLLSLLILFGSWYFCQVDQRALEGFVSHFECETNLSNILEESDIVLAYQANATTRNVARKTVSEDPLRSLGWQLDPNVRVVTDFDRLQVQHRKHECLIMHNAYFSIVISTKNEDVNDIIPAFGIGALSHVPSRRVALIVHWRQGGKSKWSL